jgi:putative hemolysin
MELVSKNEFKELVNYNRLGKDVFADVIFQLLKLNKVNELYNEHYQKSPHDFIDAIIAYLGIKYTISKEDLKRIPKEGSFVVISNHPFGALDGILLYKVISEVRPDFKIMANFLLQRIEPLRDCFFSVNPFETKKNAKSSVKGLRNAIDHVINEHPLGIFPAGEVSSFNFAENRIADKEWDKSIIKFVVNCESPIVPVFISGTNSALFHALGRIHPMLRTAQLPSELFNKKDKTIQIRIGSPIQGDEIYRFGSVKELGRFLRAKTYSLGNSLDIEGFYKKPLRGLKKHQEEIIKEVDKDVLINEIESLKAHFTLFEMNNYSVLCTTVDKIPHVIVEIGRLREITFREVDEGTNKSVDLDQYDVYYNHLIIWDNNVQKIVGSYRIGKGKEIIEDYGIKGFYSRSLFKIDSELTGLLEQSLELGRSFIVKEYQRKAMPLFLLWKGIFYFLLQNKEYRYLIGPVSISNSFSKFTKSLIVAFVKSNFYNDELAQFIQPRKQFKIPKKHMPEIHYLVDEITNDIDQIDSIVYDLENDKRIPVLLKKYLSLNAKIIGFNVDPLFNNCLDGLLLLDLLNVPKEMIETFSKDLQNDQSELSNISLLREKTSEN